MPSGNDGRTTMERAVDCLTKLAEQPRSVHVLVAIFAVLLALALVILAFKV